MCSVDCAATKMLVPRGVGNARTQHGFLQAIFCKSAHCVFDSIYAKPTPYPLTCTPLARDIIFMLRGSMFPRGLAMYSYVYGGPPNLDYLKTRGAQRRYV